MKSEKEETVEEPFVIRPYLKSELAHLYNPYVPLVYAMRKMREWIRNNKELYDAMYSGGEGKNDHAYSARQVRLIVKYLDTPWDSLWQVRISYNENKISYNEIRISYNEKKISYNDIPISYNEILICHNKPQIIYNELHSPHHIGGPIWLFLLFIYSHYFLYNNVRIRRRERIFFFR